MESLNRRWLLSEEGIAFVNQLTEMIGVRLNKRTEGGRSEDVSFAAATTASRGDPALDWDAAIADFKIGLFAVLGDDKPTEDELAMLLAHINDVYKERFVDLYGSFDDLTLFLQAIILGQLTANMYRLNKGALSGYPNPDPNVRLSNKHLEWARDIIGFWAHGKNNLNTGMPAPITGGGSGFVEFDKGCTLC